jgi:hypothetical protein
MGKERVVNIDGQAVRFTIERSRGESVGSQLPKVRFALVGRVGLERHARSMVLVDEPSSHDLDTWPESNLIALARQKLL